MKMHVFLQSSEIRFKGNKKTLSTFIVLYLIILSGCQDLLFEDKSKGPISTFDIFWKEVDRNYSFFLEAKVNWDSVYRSYRPLINEKTSKEELFQTFDVMLNLLNDAHTNVYTPMGTAGNAAYFSKFPTNPILADPSGSYFENYTDINRIFSYGTLHNSTAGYLRIKTFEGNKSDFEEVDQALKALKDRSGLIIDVRSNLGGIISNGEVVAGRFIDSDQVGYEYRVRNGERHTDFSPWYTVITASNSIKLWKNKPVMILTNRQSFSATEWFVLLMDLAPKVQIVGDTTGGGGSVPITRELPNGWTLRISNTQTRLPSGRMFQGTGIYPDVPVWISKEDESNSIDTILEKAMELLR
jgi:hypothetical protein